MKRHSEHIRRINIPLVSAGLLLAVLVLWAVSIWIENTAGTDTEQTAGDCPAIYIVTDDETAVETKDYVSGSLSVTSADYNVSGLEMEIRCRGNSSLGREKKSYNIRLEDRCKLLGLGEGRGNEWVLLANADDASLLRNYTGFRLAGYLGGIKWTPDCEIAEVYLNGQYRGVYLLTERIEASEKKVNVNISKAGKSEDIGFLAELTGYPDENNTVVYGRDYTIKSEMAEDDGLRQKQLDNISTYLTECLDAAEKGDRDRVTELMDTDSLVDIYLVSEISKDMDIGWDSFYMYRNPGGQLIFGPVWDFDLSLGNVGEWHYSELYNYEGLYAAAERDELGTNPWFHRLIQHKWFRQLVRDRWNEISAQRGYVLTDLQKMYDEHHETLARNFEAWPPETDPDDDDDADESTEAYYADEYSMLVWYIEQRYAWLDSTFNSDEFVSDDPADIQQFMCAYGEDSGDDAEIPENN